LSGSIPLTPMHFCGGSFITIEPRVHAIQAGTSAPINLDPLTGVKPNPGDARTQTTARCVSRYRRISNDSSSRSRFVSDLPMEVQWNRASVSATVWTPCCRSTHAIKNLDCSLGSLKGMIAYLGSSTCCDSTGYSATVSYCT
jgi:hypothetical protein